jgi:sialate O-acetylesterase
MKISLLNAFVVALSLLSVNTAAQAELKLPTIIDSHMVLQRDAPITIWGWDTAGTSVEVSIAGNSEKAKAGDDGKWAVKLPALKADGKAHSMTIAGSSTVKLEDILVGEVWVGSGQSNMEWQLRNTFGSKEAIATAKHPNIRLFHIPKVSKPKPVDDVNAKWKACTPENVPTFSAVLYYFGRKVHEEIDVPVGLINSSWGGSPIEPWTVTSKSSGGMYNGMIAPIVQFKIQGAIWYQGETNVIGKNGFKYFDKTKALIEGWRGKWGHELPFYFVQIAPWSGRYDAGQLPALWEAQVASLKIPKTGMAVTTDLVDQISDIHPRNKLDVGNRLARWALTKTYGKKGIVYSGPLYKSSKVDGNKVVIEFAHAEGLKSRDGKPLTEFKIAGADGKFVEATATIKDSTVVVSADSVSEPKTVQFGWHKIANPNLVNGAGLPASPFQSDKWRGGTGEK